MPKSPSPFVLSIEPTGAKAFVAGSHLGTDLAIAMAIAAERFAGRNAYGLPTQTVALLRSGKLVAVYDGDWAFTNFGLQQKGGLS